MKNIIVIIALIFVVVPKTTQSGKTVVYYTNWSQYRPCNKFMPENIEPIVNLITDINYAFAKLDTSGNVIPIEWNDCPSGAWPGCQGPNSPNSMYDRIFNLKHKNENLTIAITIGGWSWGGTIVCPTYSAMAANSVSRARFVQQSIQFARTFGFDAIDIDWEYPGAIDLGCSANDAANFISLMSELRTAIDDEAEANPNVDKLILSIAAPAAATRINAMQLSNAVQFLDYVNVMAYDYHGSWESITGINAPLYKYLSGPYADFNVNTTVQIYNTFGVDKSKFILGMPTYGRSWTISSSNCNIGAPTSGPGAAGRCTGQTGILAYYEIEQLISSPGLSVVYDNITQTPYAYSSSGTWISYDNELSITKKAELVKRNKWGGSMFWSLDFDDFTDGYPLITAAINCLNN